MIQCQICQVANDDIAQFCKECGGRLTPAKPAMAAPVQPQQVSTPEPLTAKPKLRSPLFGGGGGAADNDNDMDDEVQPVLNKPKSKGLRSPLLGAVEEDDEPFEPKARDAKPKGGMRSPMFGGDKNKEHKSTFPHRSHDVEDHEPSPAAKLEPGRHQSKGLRSPLLGGDDFDPEAGIQEDPGINAKASGQLKAHHRMRSPLLGDDDGYEDQMFDDEVEDIDDPNVLRSPLLAVKTPRAKTPSQPAPAPAPAPAPPAPVQQAPMAYPPIPPQPQAQPAPQPVMQAPAMPYTQQQQPQAQPMQPQAFAGNGPQGPPQAPTSAPRYEPKPAPSPTASQFGMAAQNPNQYEYGVQPGVTSHSANANPNSPSPAPIPMAPPMPQPQAVRPSVVEPELDSSPKKGLRGSKLLSGGDEDDDQIVGPQDRRSKSRERRLSRPDRRTGAVIDDEDEDFMPVGRRPSVNGGGGGGANPMAPLLMASSAVALIAKAYIFVPLLGNPDLFTKNMPYVVDSVSTMAVLLCLIMFAMKASQKG